MPTPQSNVVRVLVLLPKPSLAPAWFQGLDRNQDGDLSLAEYIAPSFLGGEAGFNETDTDKDCLIDEQEASAAKRGKARE